MDNKRITEEKPTYESDTPCPNCSRYLLRSITDPTGCTLHCWYCDEEFRDNLGEQFGERAKK